MSRISRYLALFAFLLVAAFAAACGDDGDGTPTPTPVTSPTADDGNGPLPDLVPAGIAISVEDPSDCTQRSNLGSFILVMNQGSGDAGPFTVEAGGQVFEFDGAAAGSTIRKWFPYSGWETGPVSITVQYPDAESDTTNNTTSQAIPVPTPIPSCTPTPAAATATPS